MNIESQTQKEITLCFLFEELVTIHQALNEVQNGLGISKSGDAVLPTEDIDVIMDNTRKIHRNNAPPMNELYDERTKTISVVISFSREHLRVICNSLQAVLDEIEEWEFGTRMGRTRDEVIQLLNDINAIPSGN